MEFGPILRRGWPPISSCGSTTHKVLVRYVDRVLETGVTNGSFVESNRRLWRNKIRPAARSDAREPNTSAPLALKPPGPYSRVYGAPQTGARLD